MDTQYSDNLDLDEILQMLSRNIWVIVVPLIVGTLLAVAVFFYLPKTYRSTTIIMVEKQKVPENYVQSSASVDVGQRLNNIQQQIMSRSLLKLVIDEFGLYAEASGKKTPDQLAEIMQNQIQVGVRKMGATVQTFSISFMGPDPKTVMDVTNRLTALFIEENLRIREEFVEGTTEFLDSELAHVKTNLEAQEDELRKFGQRYMGELPDQIGANLRKLDRLQIELQSNSEALSKAKERRSVLMDRNRLVSENFQEGIFELDSNLSPGELKLALLEAELADLRKTFTEKYPDVIQIKKELALLKESDSESGPGARGNEALEGSELYGLTKHSEEFRQLGLEFQNLTAKQARITEQIDLFEKRVENTPLRQQAYLALSRDYENTKGHYQSILDKKLNAEISQNLEKRQKGEKFRILDPANFPVKPFSPNFLKIILMGFMGGAGLGGGLAYLRELMDSSFKKVEEVQAVFSFPVLASIPNMKNL